MLYGRINWLFGSF